MCNLFISLRKKEEYIKLNLKNLRFLKIPFDEYMIPRLFQNNEFSDSKLMALIKQSLDLWIKETELVSSGWAFEQECW